MKKFGLATALLLANSAFLPSFAGSAPIKFDVTLDTFCNTFKLQEAEGWEVYGIAYGCGHKATVGGVIAELSGSTYIVVSDKDPHSKIQNTWFFTLPVHGAGSWYLYLSDGKSLTEHSSGTYSKTTKNTDAANAGKKSAIYGRN